jgi:hypothetical protein
VAPVFMPLHHEGSLVYLCDDDMEGVGWCAFVDLMHQASCCDNMETWHLVSMMVWRIHITLMLNYITHT